MSSTIGSMLSIVPSRVPDSSASRGEQQTAKTTTSSTNTAARSADAAPGAGTDTVQIIPGAARSSTP
jgi:hypothetical protein